MSNKYVVPFFSWLFLMIYGYYRPKLIEVDKKLFRDVCKKYQGEPGEADTKKPFIIVSNHTGYNDIFIVFRYFGEAGVITVFVNKLLKNQNPFIFGDGKQTRDFVYVGDVALANLKVLNKKTNSRIFNIGTSTQITINELLLKIKKIMRKEIKPTYKKERKGEIRFNSLDINLAKKELGWEPKMDLQEGLKRTIEWFE